jgi:hypothetical protein
MNVELVNDVNPFEFENIFFALNGKKITDTNDINKLYERLPSEVAILLMSSLYNNLPDFPKKVTPFEEGKVKISDTLPPRYENAEVKRAIEEYRKLEQEDTMHNVRQHSLNSAEKPRNRKIEKEINVLTIYESGVALGIVVGQSTKTEVCRIMKKYSEVCFGLTDPTLIHYYNDISLFVFFDENNIVQELKFVNHYKGMTSKGLMIGDTIDEAIAIYGQPKMKSPKGAVWDKFAVFCDQDIITSIRICK